MRTLARTLSLGLCAISMAWIPISAEEILEKDQTRFLGWQTSTIAFTTCDKTVVKIETGKVVKTITKCQGPIISWSPDSSLQGKVFTVKSVDPDLRTFDVTGQSGEVLSVFYPTIAEKPNAIKFDLLKPGRVVGIDFAAATSTKHAGVFRAESINGLGSEQMSPQFK